MTDKNKLLQQLSAVQRLAEGTRWSRFIHHPGHYLYAMMQRELFYPISQKSSHVQTRLFYGKSMLVSLPSSTDIYLTGGKSHDSEIRLAKFLITTLHEGDRFLDIGAHVGYFSLLAAELIGDQGSIMSFEPSVNAFSLLKENTRHLKATRCVQKIVANTEEPITFYEFPPYYAEYNSTDIDQFKQESWHVKASATQIDATTLDQLIREYDFIPSLIKMDVEGSEYDVVMGGISFFNNHSPTIVMEYLAPNRMNDAHQKAADQLRQWGYSSFVITAKGQLEPVHDIAEYLIAKKLDSDNIVFGAFPY